MSSEQEATVLKLPKLNNSKDYIHWRRRAYAYIRRSDVALLGFEPEPEHASAAARKKWNEAMIKAKSVIVLSLGSGPLAQLSAVIDDDDQTAKDLWDALSTLYTTSNAQAVLNLENELESLRFNEEESWEAHLNKFHEILGKLSAYDSAVKGQDKPSKLLRTLPESFAPLAMVAQTSDMSLDRLVVAVEGELSRRKNNKKNDVLKLPKPTAASVKEGNGGPNHLGIQDGSVQKKLKNVRCFICGKNGHYAKDCWHRRTDDKALDNVEAHIAVSVRHKRSWNPLPKKRGLFI